MIKKSSNIFFIHCKLSPSRNKNNSNIFFINYLPLEINYFIYTLCMFKNIYLPPPIFPLFWLVVFVEDMIVRGKDSSLIVYLKIAHTSWECNTVKPVKTELPWDCYLLLCSKLTGIWFIQVKLTKIFYIETGLYLKFSVYSGIGLDRLHCISQL